MELTPHQLAQRRVELSAEYMGLTDRLVAILEFKPLKWQELRSQAKSDAQADRAWDGTQDGIEEMKIRWTLKAIEKKLSAARTMLEVLEGESKNQY